MVTTIQVSEETQQELFRIVTQLQAKFGRKVSYDEAVRYLIEQQGGKKAAAEKFASFFGCLKGSNIDKAWSDLKKLREEEEKRLERLARQSGD